MSVQPLIPNKVEAPSKITIKTMQSFAHSCRHVKECSWVHVVTSFIQLRVSQSGDSHAIFTCGDLNLLQMNPLPYNTHSLLLPLFIIKFRLGIDLTCLYVKKRWKRSPCLLCVLCGCNLFWNRGCTQWAVFQFERKSWISLLCTSSLFNTVVLLEERRHSRDKQVRLPWGCQQGGLFPGQKLSALASRANQKTEEVGFCVLGLHSPQTTVIKQ